MAFNVLEKIERIIPPATRDFNPALIPPFNKGHNNQFEKETYGRAGDLEVRLAKRKKEIKKAQRLRYKVFYKEMDAIPDAQTKLKRRDIDAFDKFCDHLILIDHNAPWAGKYPLENSKFIPKKPKVVGTYRMLPQAVANQHGGFYTQNEYNIAPLLARQSANHNFLELGRSCVLKSHRSKRSIELLWHGLWTYIRENNIDVMIGCASFPGTNPRDHALALSYLHHFHAAPAEWSARAHNHLYNSMNLMGREDIDMRRALKKMPPLIKGYLRLGAFFGDGAVIDDQFGTTDVMVIMPVNLIDKRYFSHFGSPDEKSSRLAKTEMPVFN